MNCANHADLLRHASWIQRAAYHVNRRLVGLVVLGNFALWLAWYCLRNL